jgi:hypothetical protein
MIRRTRQLTFTPTCSLERLPVRIVGIVDNVRSASLAAEGGETVYVPYVFNSFLPLTYVVRTAADPAILIARIRAEAAAMDPHVPYRRTFNTRVVRLERHVAEAVPAGAHRRVCRLGDGRGVARPLRRDLVFGEATDA